MTKTETLVGITTRPITVSETGAKSIVNRIETVPAGTEVYVRFRDNGTADIRVCGTLLTQTVYPSAVTCP